MKPPEHKTSLAEWIRLAQLRLHDAEVESPRESALLLAEHALALTRSRMLADPGHPLSPHDLAILEELLERRLRHEPVAYILGRKGFRDHIFTVSSKVLIPRPETEELIDLISSYQLGPKSILDAGTGTGCLAICLSGMFPTAQVCGCDFSSEALQCARSNDPDRRVHWVESDWLACFRPSVFDLIVSNPPYLTRQEILQTDPQVRNYEPVLALDGGADGCEAFRRLIPQASKALAPGGILFLEGSPTVALSVLKLLSDWEFHSIEMHCDLSGKERFFTGRK